MQRLLRQSTAQAIKFGPFVDSTDAVSPETALTIAQADMQLSKNGGTFAQKSAAGNATHDTDGYYGTTLSTTDTNTVGGMRFQVTVAGALLVWEDFTVIEESVYDDLFASSAAGYASISALATVDANVDAILLDTAEIGAAGAGLTNINLPNQTMDIVGSITGNLSGSVGSVTGNVGGIAGTINTLDALDTAQDSQHSTTQSDISSLNDIAATDIVSAGAITTLAGAVVNVDLVDVTTTNTDMRGTDSAATATALATAQTDLDTITGSDGVTLATTQSLYTPAVAGDAMGLTAQGVDDIWDEPLTNGSHNVTNSAGRRLRELETGAVIHADDTQAGSTTSQVVLANAASNIDDFYTHKVFIIGDESRLIVGYVGSTRTVTLDEDLLTGAPSNNTPYEVLATGPVYTASMRLGYTDDKVFIDTLNGAAGTVVEINGIQDNASDTITDATTIATSIGSTIFDLAPGSTITPAATFTNWQWLGRAATINLNGQQYPNNTFERHFLSGNISASTASQFRVLSCQTSGNVTWPMNLAMGSCGINGNITFNATGTANIFDGINPAGTAITIDLGAAITTGAVSFVNHHAAGGLTFSNITGTQSVVFFGIGQITLDSSCTGGTFICGGDVLVTDNSAGTTVSGLAQESILSDTNELQTDDIPGLIAALNDISTANVNTEIVDALSVDTYSQPGQGTPAATASLATMLSYVYKVWRNRSTQTSSEYALYNDNGITVDQKATFSDDGTTADLGEVSTGP